MTVCTRCPRYRRPVSPSGPIPARVMFIGECPSTSEDAEDRPFCGKTGIEFDRTYLPILGLPRSDVYVTNAVLCSRKDYSNPSPIDADCCAGIHLGITLSKVQPTVVVPMGAVACSLWPSINLPLDHGLPMVGQWGSWRGVLFPSYHPSAGIHSSGFMIPLQADFAALAKFLRKLDTVAP